MRIFWQLRWYFQQKWKHYVGSILLFAVISTLQLVPPKAVGIIVDDHLAKIIAFNVSHTRPANNTTSE